MKLSRWLVDVQTRTPKWPYLLCAGFALFWGFAQFGPYGCTPLIVGLSLALACLFQLRWPTVLLWAMISCPFLAAGALAALRINKGNLPEYFLLLLAAFIPITLRVAFRPRFAGIQQASIAILFCVLGSVGVIRAEQYYEYLSQPLGPPQELPLGKIPIPMSGEESASFLNKDFRIVRHLSDMPAAVRQYFTESGGSRLTMADPGEPFEASDFITDASIPRFRLIFGGTVDDRTFLYYEAGGIAHSYHLLMFQITEGRIVKEGRAACLVKPSNLAELRSAARSRDCRQF